MKIVGNSKVGMKTNLIPFFFIFAILGIVVMIVLYDGKSMISRFAQMISRNVEGFASPVVDTPQCPPGGYTFFTDRRGESFCCKGRINPYTHVCEANDDSGLCAFRPNTLDPRNRNRMLPLCSSMIVNNHSEQQASCPGSLPNYASIGKCCLNDPDLDGFDCVAKDNADFKKYCKLAGPLKPGEQLCSALNMVATATCPKQIPGQSMYTTGAREVAAYGAAAGGVNVPVCFGMDSVCIPDAAISYLQSSNGLYKDKDIPTWAYSCSGWNTTNVSKDTTVQMDTSYLPNA